MVTVLADGPTELYRQLPSTVGRPHAAIPLPLSPLAQRFRRKTFEMQILNCRSAATLLVVRKHAETISTASMVLVLWPAFVAERERAGEIIREIERERQRERERERERER